MSIMLGKKIVLGVSGSIAAYKSADLVRRLRDLGAEVRVVMSPAARAFITPLTLQALSGYPVSDDLLDTTAEAAMGHIMLAKWADLLLIAPATADVLARLAVGIADDLLTTLCLATNAPIAVAPAMNQQMYHALATQNNLRQLAAYGWHIWGPATGSQACGDQGLGRMLEPIALVSKIEQLFSQQPDLQGIRVLLTAGPTQELVDPIRFISNRSSGKMGFAIAQAAAARGASVTLISGPVALETPYRVNRRNVISALEMSEAVMQVVSQHDIFISCAAVADYRPQAYVKQKIKKRDDVMMLTLVKNPDIVAQVGQLQQNRPYTVGFAAETENIAVYAHEKLRSKNLDLLCVNDVSQPDQGFNSETNQLHLYWPQDHCPQDHKILPLTDKVQLAQQLIDEIIDHYHAKNRH